MYALRGLGATPPPTVLGFDWFSYNQPRCIDVPATSKVKYGCVVHDGVAWGKMPKAEAELKEGPTAGEFCVAMYDNWAKNNPDKAACLSANDKAALIAGCGQAARGETTQEYFVTTMNQIIAQRCGEIYHRQCTNDMQAWANLNPEAATCLGPSGAETVLGWCMQTKHGILSQDGMRDALARLLEARCPAEPEVTDEMPGAPGPVDLPGQDVTEPPPSDTTLMQPTQLRQWGPVVGIGLILAIGLTLATRKRKRKR